MPNRLTHIDPTKRVLPSATQSCYVHDERDSLKRWRSLRLDDEVHQLAVQRFLLFDAIARLVGRLLEHDDG